MFQNTPAFKAFFYFFMIVIGVFVFFPLLWLINTALKPADKMYSLYFFLGELTLDNIIGIIKDKTIPGNSIAVDLFTYAKNRTLGQLLVAAYQLCSLYFTGGNMDTEKLF